MVRPKCAAGRRREGARPQAYNKQQEAIGEEAIKQIQIVELISAAIQDGKIKIVPDVLVTGGGCE